MSHIQDEIKRITATLPTNVRLVAVSKYQPLEKLKEAYDCGQRLFGESHAQELKYKQEHLPQDIEWHFIGHLQTNKVKYIAPFVSMIHSVDSYKLLCEIDKQARKSGRIIPCLIQIHIAKEETKFGFTPEECKQFFMNEDWKNLTHIQIKGLMCMATNTDNTDTIQEEFHQVHALFLDLKNSVFSNNETFNECSWGMSDDYPIAIKEGSTLIRVGSSIFGSRMQNLAE